MNLDTVFENEDMCAMGISMDRSELDPDFIPLDGYVSEEYKDYDEVDNFLANGGFSKGIENTEPPNKD